MNLRNANEKKKANIEIIISAISTIFVLLTLFEMKAERNAAYKPEISISNSQIAIVWDETDVLQTKEKPMILFPIWLKNHK